MRLFAAVRLTPDVQASLDAVTAPLRAAHVDLRWVDAADWHLTLAFYGEVPAPDVPALRRALDGVLTHPAFDLRLAGAGRFRHDVLWAGVTGDTEELAALAATARTAGELEPPATPYVPHLTLARRRRRTDLTEAVKALHDYESPAWTVRDVDLLVSHPDRRPRYAEHSTWPLTGVGSLRTRDPASDG